MQISVLIRWDIAKTGLIRLKSEAIEAITELLPHEFV